MRSLLMLGLLALGQGTVAAGSAAASAEGAGTGLLRGKVVLERDGETLEDHSGAVVYIVGFEEPAPEAPARMRQADGAFLPPVLPITQGQSVTFPNEDDIRHNVFSTSRAREFDLGLGRPGAAPEVAFSRTGVVDVYCNIHPDMSATILVLPNRAFAVTEADGYFEIEGVPAGEHTVFVWHPLADPERRTVTVTAGETLALDWTVALTKVVTPHLDKHGRPYRQRGTRY